MKIKMSLLVLVFALSLAAAGGRAARNEGVERPRDVLSGGAFDLAGVAGVTIRATLGQPVVGVPSNEDLSLGQGFWHGAIPGHAIYLPLVLK